MVLRIRKIIFVASVLLPLFVVSCSSFRFSGNRVEDIQSSDPQVRVKSIVWAAKWKVERAVPLIVDRLEDEDGSVRIAAVNALRQMTGQDFGYRCYEPAYKRAGAVERWREWVKEMTKD